MTGGSPPAHHGARVFLDPSTGLHVHESGDIGSPAILFVHGGGPSGRMWQSHLEALAGSFHCLAPDLPGFGLSRHLPALSPADTADLLARLVAGRLHERRAHLVGLSYGGAVAFALLARHADVVDRAVIDGAGVLSSWVEPVAVAAAVLASPIVASRVSVWVLRAIGLRELASDLRFSVAPAAFRRAWCEGFTVPMSPDLLTVPCPTLLVAGEREATVRASNAGLAELMPAASAWFVPALNHAWFTRRLDLHVAMLEAWFAEGPLPAGLVPEPRSAASVTRVRNLLARERQRQRHSASMARPPDPTGRRGER